MNRPHGLPTPQTESTEPGMVLINGCPKSGTHAVMELLASMGVERAPGIVNHDNGVVGVFATPADPNPVSMDEVRTPGPPRFIHAHVPAGDWDLGAARVIAVLRDPRNVLVSWTRWRNRDTVTEAALLDALDWFYDTGPFVEVYRSFLGWRGRALVVRYEDVPRDFSRVDLYEEAEQDRSTWMSSPSDWRACWTTRVDEAFREAGGLEMLVEAGYPEPEGAPCG